MFTYDVENPDHTNKSITHLNAMDYFQRNKKGATGR